MSTNLLHIYEVACLEQALLTDLNIASELARIEKSLKAASDKLQILINQFN